MRVAVLNSGTATLKAAIADAEASSARIVARAELDLVAGAARDVAAAFEKMAVPLASIRGVGHRIVHGGAGRAAPARIDDALEHELTEISRLAPLHNPIALEVVRAARALLPDRPQVAVFDTAFHAARAAESLRYALPWDLADELAIRRTGFHGIAHQSLLESLSVSLGSPPESVSAVTLQLGAGCSACAIRGGRSIETSMGFTPLEGLPMATRCGDVDAGAVLALLRSGRSVDEVERLLTRESGLLGLAGSADLREVLRCETQGDERARVAIAVFVRRVVATIGAYLTLLDGRGALVFGGGIGARSPEIRQRIAAGLSAWSVALEPERNAANGPGRISRPGTREVFVFTTDEETLIARATAARLEGSA